LGFGHLDTKKLALAKAFAYLEGKDKRTSPPKVSDESKRKAAERRKRILQENQQQAEIIRRHRAQAADRRASGLKCVESPGDEWLDLLPNRNSDKRYQMLSKARPAWANQDAINEIYQERDRLNESNPADPFTVDHIYPILGKTVCGLHVADNLKIIRRSENSIKNNKHPDELKAA